MIKSQITLKQLEAFAFVIDLGTFRAAATALGTTQPNISARIAALEKSLDATLMIRDAGSVRLTERGALLLEKARDVLWASEALLEEAGRQDILEERLRLGVTELVACSWLQPFLRLFKLSYPNIRVELQVNLSTEINTQLMDRQLDLAFQTGPFDTKLSGQKSLGEIPYVWAATPDLTSKVGMAPRFEDLFEFPIITHARHTQAGQALHAMAQEKGLGESQIVHSSALAACVPMVCEGLGIALLPCTLVRQEIASGELCALASDWLPEPLVFYARYAADRAPRYVAQAADMAHSAMQSLEKY